MHLLKAQELFNTSFGAAIAGQSGLSGYPAGTVNRHVFSGELPQCQEVYGHHLLHK